MTDHPLESGHPLTDEMCKQIQLHIFNQTDKEGIVVVADCMRDAYDRGFEDAIEIIEQRGLAHWSALYEAQEDFYNKTNQQEGS